MVRIAYPGRRDVGVHHISIYAPKLRVTAGRLAQARGKDTKHYTEDLGVQSFAVPNADEDIVSMGANAMIKALKESGLAPSDILGIYASTESSFDNSKPLSSFIMEPLEQYYGYGSFRQPSDENKFACKPAADQIERSISQIIAKEEKHGYYAVIAADVGKYALATPSEPTSGAQAACVLIGRDPIISIDPRFIEGVTIPAYDFWKSRIHRGHGIVSGIETPSVDGSHSNYMYAQTTSAAYMKLEARANGFGVSDLYSQVEYIIVHLPYSGMGKTALAVPLTHQLREHQPASYKEFVADAIAAYNSSVDRGVEKGAKLTCPPGFGGLTTQHMELEVLRLLYELGESLSHSDFNRQRVLMNLGALSSHGVGNGEIKKVVERLNGVPELVTAIEVKRSLEPVDAAAKQFKRQYAAFRKGVTQTALFKAEFDKKIAPSLVFSAMLGNGYSATEPTATYSTIWNAGLACADTDAVLIFYGSGSGAVAMWAHIEHTVVEFLKRTNADNILTEWIPIEIEQYERLHATCPIGVIPRQEIIDEGANSDKYISLYDMRRKGAQEKRSYKVNHH